MGKREAQLKRARAELANRNVKIMRASAVTETEPFGVREQRRFLNQVLEVGWDGTARSLLEVAKQVEHAVGRRPRFRWGPREIDVDILLFGDQVIREADLQIPHPGLAVRPFFVEPLLEINPALAEVVDRERRRTGVIH